MDMSLGLNDRDPGEDKTHSDEDLDTMMNGYSNTDLKMDFSTSKTTTTKASFSFSDAAQGGGFSQGGGFAQQHAPQQHQQQGGGGNKFKLILVGK